MKLRKNSRSKKREKSPVFATYRAMEISGYSPLAKIRTPCTLQASLQNFGRRMRTDAFAASAKARRNEGATPASTKGTHPGAFCAVFTGQFRCRICVIQFRCSAMVHFSLGETGACKWPRSSGLAEPCLQTSLCILRSDPSFFAFILPFHKNKPNARFRSVWLCSLFS